MPIKRIRVKPETLDTSNSGFQIAMDVILLVLPISVVLGLNTNRKAKGRPPTRCYEASRPILTSDF